MIIVTGSITAKPETFDQIRTLSLEHVRRSRGERGCLLHSVHQDVEDPLRLVFVEHWQDRDALNAHFQVPASGEFVAAASALAVGNASMQVYEANRIR
ncbi:MAG TPA: putative quinol monooxygenase [Acidimicrobiales bacterium]|jgi:quinol monooxygenase YgiN|nr:putative quinol monooxygenase [Acidimicrobiales bacterium]